MKSEPGANVQPQLPPPPPEERVVGMKRPASVLSPGPKAKATPKAKSAGTAKAQAKAKPQAKSTSSAKAKAKAAVIRKRVSPHRWPANRNGLGCPKCSGRWCGCGQCRDFKAKGKAYPKKPLIHDDDAVDDVE